MNLSRRQFLSTALLATSGLTFGRSPVRAADRQPFSFVLLGDLHFDRLEHHDLEWLAREKPDDLRQVRDYSRITAEIMPKLFAVVRGWISESSLGGHARVAFVAQAGDFVEGLCGSEKLATEQNQQAIAFVREAKLGVPFLFAKGNHDVTGAGAQEAFRRVFHPFLTEQRSLLGGGTAVSGACYGFEHGGAQFCFFDAYDKDSLAWLEAVLGKRTAPHCLVVLHPPVVPYGARSTWHLYAGERQKAQREKLLNLLGQHNAIVLSGHIHRYNLLVRQTPRRGRFLQLALSSVVSTLEVKAKQELSGLRAYTADQVKVEPQFSPDTEHERRVVYEQEAPFVTQFEYADLPGYAVLTVNGTTVEARVFAGVSRQPWRTLNLSSLLRS